MAPLTNANLKAISQISGFIIIIIIFLKKTSAGVPEVEDKN